MSLIRHLPKRGFTNFPFRRRYDVVNLETLEAHFEPSATVGLETLQERGLLKVEHGRLKVLGNGTLTKSLHIVADAVSKAAREKIEAAGGVIEIVSALPKKSE